MDWREHEIYKGEFIAPTGKKRVRVLVSQHKEKWTYKIYLMSATTGYFQCDLAKGTGATREDAQLRCERRLAALKLTGVA